MDQRSGMVESLDNLKSSRSIKGTHGPEFELLDAKIASALNQSLYKLRIRESEKTQDLIGILQLKRFIRRRRNLFITG